MVDREQLTLLLTGLAAGDSLGSTSEFVPQDKIPACYEKYRPMGWPFKQVGGGGCGWQPGEPTDDSDMALCVVKSCLELGRFDGDDVARRFVAWMDSRPKDIGGTTMRTLRSIADGTPWYEGGLAEYQRNPGNAANGSLMRNGIVLAFAEDLEEAFCLTIKQSIITHYAPLMVLCCAAHTYLLDELSGQIAVANEEGWVAEFRDVFTLCLKDSEDEIVLGWRENVGDDLDAAWLTLEAADFDHESFNPFKEDFSGREGYCLLTLQIAAWAAAWSFDGKPFPTPKGFPAEPFQRTKAWVLSWVAMIGHDCDTYGASAGPLIALTHNGLPEELTQELSALIVLG